MAWEKKKTNEWKVNKRRDPCECSQHLKLQPTGYTSTQCPEFYCEVCRIGFWVCLFKPSAQQISEAKKTDPSATEETMKYYALRNKPLGVWGKTSETMMIDQLGGKLPWFLSNTKRKYWMKKYADKYPNSDKVKKWKDLKSI